jgi:hypothetical protein
MRGKGTWLAVLLGLGSVSCMRLLFPDYECEDVCLPATRQCSEENATQVCILEPFFGCLVWTDDVHCDDRRATCVDAECVCAPGASPCGPHAVCSFLDSDPLNCGGCGIECARDCVGGQCAP